MLLCLNDTQSGRGAGEVPVGGVLQESFNALVCAMTDLCRFSWSCVNVNAQTAMSQIQVCLLPAMKSSCRGWVEIQNSEHVAEATFSSLHVQCTPDKEAHHFVLEVRSNHPPVPCRKDSYLQRMHTGVLEVVKHALWVHHNE